MKKGFLLLVVIAMTAFFIHGCHSSGASKGPDNSKRVGYPIGHEQHPDTEVDPTEETHPLQGYS